jgi:hypothetical protein
MIPTSVGLTAAYENKIEKLQDENQVGVGLYNSWIV